MSLAKSFFIPHSRMACNLPPSTEPANLGPHVNSCNGMTAQIDPGLIFVKTGVFFQVFQSPVMLIRHATSKILSANNVCDFSPRGA